MQEQMENMQQQQARKQPVGNTRAKEGDYIDYEEVK